MRIEKVHIKGFRNYDDAVVEFGEKTLVFGPNDSGKTNLLYALRVLFDPNLSAKDFELTASDFNCATNPERVEITATLCDIHEKCLVSVFGGKLKDGRTDISYVCERDGNYAFFAGNEIDGVERVQSRFYIKHLVLEYVDSTRDAARFLKRSQAALLEAARNVRNEDDAHDDEASIRGIQDSLESLNKGISGLHYIADALKSVNDEMVRISALNEGREARLVAGNTDAGKLLDNLQLAYLSDDAPLTFGGEGRSNQLFFSTWLSQRSIRKPVEKVSIVVIEEPEAHLHPQQQRALAKYLSGCIDGQVILTTHSPQVVEQFTSDALVMTGSEGKPTCSGSDLVGEIEALGYRLNPIVAEVFFSRGVFLVEGPSEVVFFRALAEAVGVDLNRENLSILSVDGVGFKPYVFCCKALGIPWVLRTDNDVFKVPKREQYRLAGVMRAYNIAESLGLDSVEPLWSAVKESLVWNGGPAVPVEIVAAVKGLRDALEHAGIFLSDRDLEYDLIASDLRGVLVSYYDAEDSEELYDAMTARKAERMYAFIGKNADELGCLAESGFCEPLSMLKRLVSASPHDD
ncbi:ATP-dependent nuclease [Paratractidigestivibacter sp.]|uniref:ATP-dependent nuclease n=1 Tax=Paratractidigestivibacter sp. TaxID=2847316 RepID=UPI002AC8EE3E|nr:AAA family ATPase [Paratractidigestivibacter sp.]